MTSKKLGITGVDRDDNEAVLVEFSDGTTGSFTAEELDQVHPDRDDSNADQLPLPK